MKRIFKRFAALVLVLAMVAPMVPVVSFAAYGTPNEHGGLVTYNDYGASFDFNDTSRYGNDLSDMISIGTAGSGIPGLIRAQWRAYLPYTPNDQNDPKIVTRNGSDRCMNFGGFFGTLYTHNAIKGSYTFSFDLKTDPTSVKSPFAVFFRSEHRDFHVRTDGSGHEYLSEFYEADLSNNPFIGGSGMALWMSDTHEITLVIKTVKQADNSNKSAGYTDHTVKYDESFVDNMFVRFRTEFDLSKEFNNIKIMDNGEDYVYIMVGDTPLCYIRMSQKGTYESYRKTYVTNENNGITEHATEVNDTSSYYKHAVVYSPTGVAVAETNWALIRDYSRLAFVGRAANKEGGGANIYVDNISVSAYDTTRKEFTDAASKLINQKEAIYLPVTIRDFAADGLLFEYLDLLVDPMKPFAQITPPVAQISTHRQGISATQTGQINSTMFAVYLHSDGKTAVDGKAYSQVTAPQSVNNDGTYTYTSTGTKPIITYNLYGTSPSLNDFWGVAIAFKTSYTGKMKLTTYSSGWSDADKDKYSYVMELDTAKSYPLDYQSGKDYSKYDYVGASSDPNYPGFKVAFFPISSKAGGGRNGHLFSDGSAYDGNRTFDRIDLQFAESSDVKIDILYTALISDDSRNVDTKNQVAWQLGGTDSSGNKITTVQTNYQKNNAKANAFLNSIYPVTRFDVTENSDVYVTYNLTSSTQATADRYMYGVDGKKTIKGYIFLRYRTSVSGANFSFFAPGQDAYCASGVKYIADGQWHDIIIPIQVNNDLTKLRYDIIDNGKTGIVDVSTLRFIPENTLYNDSRTGDQGEDIYYTKYATKNGYSGGTINDATLESIKVTQPSGGSASKGYYSAIGFSRSGKLDLYNYQGNMTFPSAFAGRSSIVPMQLINTGIADGVGAIAVRYKTDTIIPNGITVHFGPDDNNMTAKTFVPIADGNWHVKVLDISGYEPQIKRVWLTFDHEGGNKYINVSELCFYKNVSSATYYNNDYNSYIALKDIPDHDGTNNRVFFRDMLGFSMNLASRPDDFSDENTPTNDIVNTPNREIFGLKATCYLPLETKYGTLYQNAVNQGLVKPTITADGKLEYTDATVDYITHLIYTYIGSGAGAGFVDEDKYGNKKYEAIHGEESIYLGEKAGLNYPIDMASYLRTFASNFPRSDGNFEANKSKIEDLATLKQHATSCKDIAYFLLSNLFTDKYAQEISEYNAIKLVQGTDNNGNKSYTFDTSRINTVYDPRIGESGEGHIYNTDFTYSETDRKGSSFFWNKQHFNPLGSGRSEGAEALGQGDSFDKVLQFMDSYKEYNFHYTMESKAVFEYREAEDLFFSFQGDDDVYLFINNKLVLDMGGGHSCAKVEVRLNPLAESLGLIDGEEYSFHFFYMERHSEAANLAIDTNMRLASPNMKVEKNAYQENEKGVERELSYGDNIDTSKFVNYEFYLENSDKNSAGGSIEGIVLGRLEFSDSDIGVKFDWENGLTYTASERLDLSNIVITHYGAPGVDGKRAETKDTNPANDTIKSLLETGIKPQEAIGIKGIKYKLSPEQIQLEYFENTVNVIAQYEHNDGKWHSIPGQDVFLVNASKLHIYLEEGTERSFNILDVFESDSRLGKSTFSAFLNSQRINKAQAILCDGEKNTVNGVTSGADIQYIANGGAAFNTTPGNDIRASYKDTSSARNNIYVKRGDTAVTTFSFKLVVEEKILDTNGNDTGNRETYVYGPFNVSVYTYGLIDKSYALDYGLPVKVETGFNNSSSTAADDYLGGDDVLKLSANPYATTVTFMGNNVISQAYGSIAADSNGAVTYTPGKFLEGADAFVPTVGISEASGDYSITKGVTMTKNVYFVPAPVMYYEESMPGITYHGNVNKVNPGNKYYQNADQSLPYGYDDTAYRADETTSTPATPGAFGWYDGRVYDGPAITNGSGGLNNFGYNYNFSNGSYAYLDTDKAENYKVGTNGLPTSTPVMKFTFSGTGFELISSTNLTSGVINVLIFEGNGPKAKEHTRYDEEGNVIETVKVPDTVYNRPVVLTYTAGELYQVPVFKWDAAESNKGHGKYYVEVYASNMEHDYMYRTLVIDGVRIYDPVQNVSDITSKYNRKENGAEIYAVKDLITVTNKAAFGSVSVNESGEYYAYIGTEGSVVEKVFTEGGASWGTSGGTINRDNDTKRYYQYLYATIGPNHESYIDKNTALVFQVKPDTSVAPADRTFQIETRLIDSTAGRKSVNVEYTVNGTVRSYSKPVNTFTAMYYELDMSGLSDSGSMVAVSPKDGMVCITNIKVNGYILTPITASGSLNDTTGRVYDALLDVVTESGVSYNDALEIFSVTSSAKNGKLTLNVVTSAAATSVKVYDENGNAVAVTQVKRSTFGSNVVKLEVTVNIPATKGEYRYKIGVADANNAISTHYVEKQIKVA